MTAWFKGSYYANSTIHMLSFDISRYATCSLPHLVICIWLNNVSAGQHCLVQQISQKCYVHDKLTVAWIDSTWVNPEETYIICKNVFIDCGQTHIHSVKVTLHTLYSMYYTVHSGCMSWLCILFYELNPWLALIIGTHNKCVPNKKLRNCDVKVQLQFQRSWDIL